MDLNSPRILRSEISLLFIGVGVGVRFGLNYR